MTAFQYKSRAWQGPLEREECMDKAERIVEALGPNPVLNDSILALSQQNGAWALDITAYVSANGQDKLAVVMVLEAADEEWRTALQEAECATKVCDSCLRRHDYSV